MGLLVTPAAALAGVWLANWLSVKREERAHSRKRRVDLADIRRDRLEELHSLCSVIEQQLLDHGQLITRNIVLRASRQAIGDNFEMYPALVRSGDVARMGALVGIYGEDLLDDYRRFIEALTDYKTMSVQLGQNDFKGPFNHALWRATLDQLNQLQVNSRQLSRNLALVS